MRYAVNLYLIKPILTKVIKCSHRHRHDTHKRTVSTLSVSFVNQYFSLWLLIIQ